MGVGLLMDILIIGVASSKFMPYLNNYLILLSKIGANVKLIIWDRLGIEENKINKYIYRDHKKSISRSLIDYYRYALYSKKVVARVKPKIIIYFGIPLLIFKKIIDNNEYPYIVDIRDYHKTLKIFKMNKIFKNSIINVISSDDFAKWLPKKTNFYVHHNLPQEKKKIFTNIKYFDEKIRIGFIGSLRDISPNIKLLDSLSLYNDLYFCYRGYSDFVSVLEKYCIKKNIKQIEFTGRYDKKEEANLYQNITFSNILLDDDLNSKTLLPNRLYYSVLMGVPIITNKGNYISTIVKKFNLGVVIDMKHNIYNQIIDYISKFNGSEFDNGRDKFLDMVISQNTTTELLIKEKISHYE